MFQRMVGTLVVAALCVGISVADEIRGVITKIDGGKVTFAKTTFDKETKKMDKGAEQTLPVADDVKVVKGMFNKDTKKMEAGEALTGGLKNDLFSKIGEKGLFATITTDSDNKKITQIMVSDMKKKKTN